jgi:chromatin remodeling complex protein RSC6
MVAKSKSAVKSSGAKEASKGVSKATAKKVPVEKPVAEKPVAEKPVAEKPVETPVVEEKVSKSKAEEKTPETPKTVEKTVVDETTQEKTTDTSVEGVFYTKLSSFISKIASINKEVKELQAMGKTLEKDFNNVIKVMSKQKNKNKNSESKRASGFAMPSLLSTELYQFLGIKEGELVPRTDVTKMLNNYIVENGLRDERDKRTILPDEKLKKILNCTDDDYVHYFNLQQFLKHHFIKCETAASTTVAVAVTA